MAMPERSVDEHGDSKSRPRKVGTASRSRVVASPAANPHLVKSVPQLKLGIRAALPDGRHDSSPFLLGPCIRHELRDCHVSCSRLRKKSPETAKIRRLRRGGPIWFSYAFFRT